MFELFDGLLLLLKKCTFLFLSVLYHELFPETDLLMNSVFNILDFVELFDEVAILMLDSFFLLLNLLQLLCHFGDSFLEIIVPST